MIYLDNAATTFPKPQNVVKSVVEAIKIYGGNPGRSGHSLSMRTSEQIFHVREAVGEFFGVSPERVVFTSNCSHALNMAIKGVMASGGHIITSTLEHNSVMRPLFAMKRKGIIDYDCAMVYEGDLEATLKSFASLIRPNTKAIVCTHASNVTGLILPVKELGELCRQAGLTFIVDGAQSAGVLPVNLQEMKIDIFCTAGHKGLYGTTGTGLMLLGSDLRWIPSWRAGQEAPPLCRSSRIFCRIVSKAEPSIQWGSFLSAPGFTMSPESGFRESTSMNSDYAAIFMNRLLPYRKSRPIIIILRRVVLRRLSCSMSAICRPSMW